MNGVGQCIDLLVPDGFERFEVEDDDVAAVIISKAILTRLSSEKIITILRTRVFPYIRKTELIKVDFKTRITYDSFAIEMDEGKGTG